MPLIQGKSQKSFKKNVETEMEAHPGRRAQNLAIAYSIKKRNERKKMADGAVVAHGPESAWDDQTQQPASQASPSPASDNEDKAKKQISAAFMFNGGAVAPEYEVDPNEMAMEEADKDLNQHMVSAMDSGLDPEVDHQMEMESPTFEAEARLAHGGDVVDRIMRKKMSEGGKVANDTPITAGFKPNEFDDLVLRDDLESSYGEDDNAGDALGNKREDDDRADIIARIMASRRKKDRMPRPA